MIRLVIELLVLTSLLTAVTGCQREGQNAQTPVVQACGAPGQPACNGGLQSCNIGQYFNGSACVFPTSGPGGSIRLTGLLSSMDATTAKNIIGQIQGCGKWGLAWPIGDARPCLGSNFSYNTGSIDIYVYGGGFYQVDLVIGGNHGYYNGYVNQYSNNGYNNGYNYGYPNQYPNSYNYGYTNSYNGYYNGSSYNNPMGIDIIAQANYYPINNNAGSELQFQYYTMKFDIISDKAVLDGAHVANDVEIKVNDQHFAVTNLTGAP